MLATGPAFTKKERTWICAIAFLEMFVMPIAGPKFGMAIDNLGIIAATGRCHGHKWTGGGGGGEGKAVAGRVGGETERFKSEMAAGMATFWA